MKICLAGEGAMGLNHIQALKEFDDIEVATLAGGVAEDAAAFAGEWEIPHHSLDLEECLGRPGIEAVLLATPNQVHADQAVLAMEMGKHVLVEIPMGLNLEEAQRVAETEKRTGRVCMVCHTGRYGAAQREVVRRVHSGSLRLHHIVQQTYFFRRENTNMFGRPRSWTDELLWHQACHMVDFMYWLFGEPNMEVWAQAGPLHSKLQILMDITIGMRSQAGCLVTSANSFNNHGPITANYRFIGEEATLLFERGKLTDHEGNEIPLSGGGLAVQDREFFDAIREDRSAFTSCSACLPVMAILDRIQRVLGE